MKKRTSLPVLTILIASSISQLTAAPIVIDFNDATLGFEFSNDYFEDGFRMELTIFNKQSL